MFLAQTGQTNKTVVWVVDGNGPAAVAEHVSGAVQALAADSENLYVATYQKLIAFDRRTGNRVGEWAVPRTYLANASDAPLLSLSAQNGKVLVLAILRNDVDIYSVNTASAATPHLVAISTSAAPGPDGSIYFVRTDHHLSYVRARPVSPPSAPSSRTIRTALAEACSLSMPWPEASYGWSNPPARVSTPLSAAIASSR